MNPEAPICNLPECSQSVTKVSKSLHASGWKKYCSWECSGKARRVQSGDLCPQGHEKEKHGTRVNAQGEIVDKWICRTCKRAQHFARKYGIDLDTVLSHPPKESCELCGDPMTGRFRHLDHNHNTGEIRGWLCKDCNTGLGQFRDSPELLAKAIEYLTERGHYGPEG